jgi:hypothetical protein
MPRLLTAEAPVELVEFLLARIAEDEAVVRGASSLHWTVRDPDVGTELACRFGVVETGGVHPTAWPGDAVHIARWSPLRVLAECEAKRRIVMTFERRHRDLAANEGAETELRAEIAHSEDGASWDIGSRRQAIRRERDYLNVTLANLQQVMRHLALPHADHPDYREEWRP